MTLGGLTNVLGGQLATSWGGASTIQRSLPVLGGTDNWSIYSLGGLQAYYDALTASSLTYTGATGATSAWADISGKSPAGERNLVQATGANQPIYLPWNGTNYAANFGVANNYYGRTALTAFGTGNFSVSSKVTVRSLAAENPIFGGGTNSFGLRIAITTGVLTAYKNGVAALTSSAATGITAGTSVVIGYTRSGTTGTYYINGASIGTITDNQDYTVGQSEISSVGAGASTANADITWGRIYTAALSASAMLADAGGTVQANIASVFSPAEANDGSASWVSSTGETWTVNTSGGKPAYIVGKPGLLGDGSAFYMKTAPYTANQPTWRVIIARVLAWSAGNYLTDGNAATTAAIIQTTGTPQLNISAGSSVAGNSGLALNTDGIITVVFNGASSLLQIGNGVPTTGNAGAGNAGGLTLFAKSDGTVPTNMIVRGVADFSVAPTAADISRVVQYFGKRWGITV